MDIYRTCREALEGQGPGRIDWVRVAVGELTAVEPELLTYSWEAVVAGGRDAGARLDVEWRPARQRCIACGGDKPRSSGSWLRICPDCGSPLQVEGGDELDVLQLCFLADDEEGGRSD